MSGVITEMGGKRVFALAVFGLVGIGAVLGGASVYFYVRNRIEIHFAALESRITTELHDLRRKVGQLKSSVDGMGPSSISLLKRPSQRGLGGYGYDSGDEEYVTAGSESEDDIEGPINSEIRGQKKEAAQKPQREEIVGEEKVFVKEIDALLEGDSNSQNQAYMRLKANEVRYPSSCAYWWRLAKATHIESSTQTKSKDEKKSLVFAAFDCASKALQINDNSGEAHKWYAITLGSKGDYLQISDKIKNGFTFKEHIDKAVAINPKDSTLYHLLGRFCYEVSSLSWIERKMAATLFSNPPSATPKDAVTNFQNCERLGKPFKENRLFLAKAYIALNDNRKAAYWLNAGASLPINSGTDRTAQDEIAKLLPKYRKYLN